MKTGGSVVCAALLASRGCRYDPAANCHLGTPEDLGTGGPGDDADPTGPGHRRNRRASYDAQCGIAFDEPAWIHRRSRQQPFPPLPDDFRDGEVTILLVRDPWEVFASYFRRAEISEATPRPRRG